jgi:hypothetical protein
LTAYTNFKITNGVLKIPVTASGKGRKTDYFDIPLNPYVKSILSDPSLKVCSITLAANNMISICISKEVRTIACISIEGVDRNLRNLTVGNYDNVVQYDLSKAVYIVENTRSIVCSF